jgi:hypothetical protein
MSRLIVLLVLFQFPGLDFGKYACQLPEGIRGLPDHKCAAGDGYPECDSYEISGVCEQAQPGVNMWVCKVPVPVMAGATSR